MPEADSYGVAEALRIADQLGVDVSVAAARADGSGAVLAHAEDRLWPGASLFKVLAAAALLREAPELLEVSVRVEPAEHVPGGSGLSLLSGPVTLTWRDLLVLMLSGSDNTAAGVILGRVGPAALSAAAREAGMTATRIAPTARTVQDAVQARHGRVTPAHDRDRPLLEHAAHDSVMGSLTTAADQIALLGTPWHGTLLSPAHRDLVLGAMSRQVLQYRISAAFGHPGVQVAGKTGTWGPFRHESALVIHHGETPIAVSILTESLELARLLPAVDDGIGDMAAALVGDLRSRRSAAPGHGAILPDTAHPGG